MIIYLCLKFNFNEYSFNFNEIIGGASQITIKSTSYEVVIGDINTMALNTCI